MVQYLTHVELVSSSVGAGLTGVKETGFRELNQQPTFRVSKSVTESVQIKYI